MTYTIPVRTEKNAGWWTEELSETYRDFFPKNKFWEFGASSWFYFKNLSRCNVIWMSDSSRWILTSTLVNRQLHHYEELAYPQDDFSVVPQNGCRTFNFDLTVPLHLSGIIGTANHPDKQKIRIIGFLFERWLHCQSEVQLLLFTVCTCV
jgi:hypothetical protein